MYNDGLFFAALHVDRPAINMGSMFLNGKGWCASCTAGSLTAALPACTPTPCRLD